MFGLTVLALAALAPSAEADTAYWSSAGNTVWDTTTLDWGVDGGPYDTTAWVNGNDAVFQGTAGSVSIASGGVSANSLLFTTDGYTIGGTGTLTLSGTNVTTGAGTDTISAVIGGTTGLTKLGSGTLSISSASNTLTGAVNVNAGTLQLNATGLAAGGSGVFSAGTHGFVVGSGATLALNQSWSLGTGVNNTVTLNGGTLSNTTGANNQFVNSVTMTAGTVSSTGSGGLRLGSASGTVAAPYWTINGGSSTASTISSNLYLMKSGLAANATFDVTRDANRTSDLNVTGTINDYSTYPGMNLTKTGNGIMKWSTVNNQMTGNVIVNGGTLDLASSSGGSYGIFNSTNTSQLGVTHNWTVNSGATLKLSNGGMNFGLGITNPITINGGSLDRSYSGATGEYLSKVTMTGGTISSSGGQPFQVGHYGDALYTVNSGSSTTSTISANLNLRKWSGTYGGTYTANATKATFNVTHAATRAVDLLVSGTISDVAGEVGMNVVKTGDGIMSLAPIAPNTYSGATILSGGWLQVNSNGLSAASNLQIDGGLLQTTAAGTFARSLGTGAGNVQWNAGKNGGFAAKGGKLTVTLGGASPLVWGSTANFISSGNSLVFGSMTADSEVDFTNNIDLGGAIRAVYTNENGNSTGDFGTLSGILSNGGLTKNGGNVLVLKGANTYTGPTTINAGTLTLASTGDIADASAIQVANGAAYTVSFNGSQAMVGRDVRSQLIDGAVGGSDGLTASALTSSPIGVQDVTMAWRAANEDDTAKLVASNVLTLGFSDTVPTGYLLEMQYNPSMLIGDESAMAASGGIYIAQTATGTSDWVNAGLHFRSDLTTLAAMYGAGLGGTLNPGDYGVDASAGVKTAWVITSAGNMDFAVVPEPGAMVLFATGLLGLLAYAWRKRK